MPKRTFPLPPKQSLAPSPNAPSPLYLAKQLPKSAVRVGVLLSLILSWIAPARSIRRLGTKTKLPLPVIWFLGLFQAASSLQELLNRNLTDTPFYTRCCIAIQSYSCAYSVRNVRKKSNLRIAPIYYRVDNE